MSFALVLEMTLKSCCSVGLHMYESLGRVASPGHSALELVYERQDRHRQMTRLMRRLWTQLRLVGEIEPWIQVILGLSLPQLSIAPQIA